MCAMNISGGYVAKQGAAYLRPRPGSGSAGSKYFKDWERKFQNLEFSVGDRVFGRKGIGNMTIAPEKLKEIEGSAKKRSEFEKLLKDCDRTAQEMSAKGGPKLIAQGFLFDNDDVLTGWSTAKNNSGTLLKYTSILNPEKSSGWFNAMTQYTKVKELTNWQKKFG